MTMRIALAAFDVLPNLFIQDSSLREQVAPREGFIGHAIHDCLSYSIPASSSISELYGSKTNAGKQIISNWMSLRSQTEW